MKDAPFDNLAEVDWIATSDRPLVVCDIDEVVLEFLTPFMSFLETKGFRLEANSFKLTGNLVRISNGRPADRATVGALIEDFYAAQRDWQTPTAGVNESLKRLSDSADILFLTAMTPVHYHARRALLDEHALPYPMIATENPKGAVLKRIHGQRKTKVVFVDDIYKNLDSVRDSLPDALLVNLMANAAFRALAPHPGDDVLRPKDWNEASAAIERFLAD